MYFDPSLQTHSGLSKSRRERPVARMLDNLSVIDRFTDKRRSTQSFKLSVVA